MDKEGGHSIGDRARAFFGFDNRNEQTSLELELQLRQIAADEADTLEARFRGGEMPTEIARAVEEDRVIASGLDASETLGPRFLR